MKKIILRYRLKKGYDKKRKCKIIDEEKLARFILKEINYLQKKISKKKFFALIIDSHLSHYLSKEHTDLCIVTKCNLKVLERRLKKRGYSKTKIRENLDAEIFRICHNEALEKSHNVIVVDTVSKRSLEKLYLYLSNAKTNNRLNV